MEIYISHCTLAANRTTEWRYITVHICLILIECMMTFFFFEWHPNVYIPVYISLLLIELLMGDVASSHTSLLIMYDKMSSTFPSQSRYATLKSNKYHDIKVKHHYQNWPVGHDAMNIMCWWITENNNYYESFIE